MYKTLDDNAVKETVREMFTIMTTVTTLEIKNYLRAKGYYAEQQQVADAMYRLWYSQGWHWTFNGTYRNYYGSLQSATSLIKPTDFPVKEASYELGLALVARYGFHKVFDDGSVPDTQKTTYLTVRPADGDYLVYGENSTDPRVFIVADTGSDAVKYYYDTFQIAGRITVADIDGTVIGSRTFA